MQPNRLLEEIFATQTVQDEGGNVIPLQAAISSEEGAILYDLVRRAGAKETIETGMAHGISSLFILQALEDGGAGRHTVIDPNQAGFKSVGLANVKRAGLERRMRFLPRPSESALPGLMDGDEQFDFAFIDGRHTFEGALIDFFYTDRMLKVGGLVVFHDLWLPALRKVVALIVRNRDYQRLEIPGQRPSFFKKARNILGNLRHHPFDPFSSGLFMDWGWTNMCVLQKNADDQRHYTFYRSF